MTVKSGQRILLSQLLLPQYIINKQMKEIEGSSVAVICNLWNAVCPEKPELLISLIKLLISII